MRMRERERVGERKRKRGVRVRKGQNFLKFLLPFVFFMLGAGGIM